jgi:hypothetical protein
MAHSAPSWHSEARTRLLELRSDADGWGSGVQSAAEPEATVWACLALLASEDQSTLAGTLELVDASAHWLSVAQRADGAVGLDAEDRVSLCRSTACAALLWSQLLHYGRPLANALRWLQQCGVLSPVAVSDPIPGCEASAVGDSAGGETGPTGFTFEATALAVLALGCNQLSGHPQVDATVGWILEQSRASGGWEPAHESPSDDQWSSAAGSTGLVLLALRATGLSETLDVTRACNYLELVLSSLDSPSLLSWALLGYQAWRAVPVASSQWLSDCNARTRDDRRSPAVPALLLLGHCPQTLALLGVTPAREENAADSAVPLEWLTY